ncbi:hypothetical protein P152DRAFT_479661 [Eremomyces bilateralis CBS 781.70]|uniref:Concanavalin A-like lectin/glucanase n=1 Tax=Eremomyces bilateralis CBS 781.70 TaxID=1392243 RepID=A0A6G1GCN1_9PEZI|nr:uncharacterized protein P152DRAFT_479661 [Eremomyces bilateralis CBS 781.70]KAF1815794.1 hypothetical protein P152DRAFT_479661 [Eremomyces bilateralis CBS 781.70]
MKFFVGSVLAGCALAQTVAPAGTELPGTAVMPRLETQDIIDGGTRKTIKHGPWVMPANKMTTKTVRGEPPCTSCYITAIQAKISFLDGKEANADQGAWLHHITLGKGLSMFWAAGNERPTLRLNRKHKYGLDLEGSTSAGGGFAGLGAGLTSAGGSGAAGGSGGLLSGQGSLFGKGRAAKRQLGLSSGLFIMADLMSMAAEDMQVTLDITYEWVPKTNTEYKGAKMEWLTVGEPKAREGTYKFDSQKWTAPWSAELLYAIGHMHDGATHSSLFLDNKEICRSIMYYNARDGYGGAAGEGHGHDMEGMDTGAAEHSHRRRDRIARADNAKRDGPSHLSDPGVCENFGAVRTGQKLRMEGWYDTAKNPLMGHNGELEDLMANMRVYMGPT